MLGRALPGPTHRALLVGGDVQDGLFLVLLDRQAVPPLAIDAQRCSAISGDERAGHLQLVVVDQPADGLQDGGLRLVSRGVAEQGRALSMLRVMSRGEMLPARCGGFVGGVATELVPGRPVPAAAVWPNQAAA